MNIFNIVLAAAAAKSLQSCPTLCDPIDGIPPGSPIPGILLARTLKWVDISFSNAWKWTVKVKLLSRFLLLATLWTAAYQAPPSMGFSRQEYWSGVPLPSRKHCSYIYLKTTFKNIYPCIGFLLLLLKNWLLRSWLSLGNPVPCRFTFIISLNFISTLDEIKFTL